MSGPALLTALAPAVAGLRSGRPTQREREED
jgi:hypothetical protein